MPYLHPPTPKKGRRSSLILDYVYAYTLEKVNAIISA